RAEIARGEVRESQNSASPPSVDFATRAAIGIRTITLRYAVTRPRPKGAPPLGLLELASPGGDPQIALDLGDAAVLRIEELGVDLLPAAEAGDVEQAGRGWELVLVLGQDRLVHRPVTAVRPQLLGLRRPQVGEEVLCLRRSVNRGCRR